MTLNADQFVSLLAAMPCEWRGPDACYTLPDWRTFAEDQDKRSCGPCTAWLVVNEPEKVDLSGVLPELALAALEGDRLHGSSRDRVSLNRFGGTRHPRNGDYRTVERL